MASMRDIQRRKASVQSTGQITKAMKLLATVKLQKAKEKVEHSKPYFNGMYDAVSSVIARSGNIDNQYLNGGGGDQKAVIVITSNRGLAGGYNANIAKLIYNDEKFGTDNTKIYAVGNKGRETLLRKGYQIAADYPEVIDEPFYSDASAIAKDVLKEYVEGNISEIYIAYTIFKNTVTQVATVMKVLPVSLEDLADDSKEKEDNTLMNYEPDENEVLDVIIPKYFTSIIYGALVEAVASENGARMAAMDSATTNAEEMIADLSLKYNRARQSSITQELTEIIAGAEAIS